VDEFELLKGALQNQRKHILDAVEGLSDSDLTTSRVPSGWTPAGLVQHLALDDERFWFRSVFDGESAERADDPVNAWDVAKGDGLAAIARYRDECTLADEVIAAHSPSDEPASWPDFFPNWRLANLYEITLHVITETAIHAGHLDIIREAIDGTQHTVVG
jgi:uncharacterized damage-inducible protein DinB